MTHLLVKSKWLNYCVWVCGFIEVGPVGKHPLVSADGEQRSVQVPRKSPFTQGQLLHLSGYFLVSLLNLNKHRLVIIVKHEH